MNITNLIDIFDESIGHNTSRRIKVIPGVKKSDGTWTAKRPMYERNHYTLAQIQADRGYPEDNYDNYSIGLKHVPDVMCIDIDQKEPCKLKDFLDKSGCYYTTTTKGFHYYAKVKDVPTFTQELEVFKDCKADFLGAGRNNIWEQKDRKVSGNKILEMTWDDLSPWMLVDKMNIGQNPTLVSKKVKKKVVPKKSNSNVPDDQDGLTAPCSDKQFQEYIDRLNPERADDYGPGNSEGWICIGIICFNTYGGKRKGKDIWHKWSSQSAKYDEDALEDKWNTFKGESQKKMGWRTLRGMANMDSPQNEYEQIYKEGGIDALVTYMNGFLCFKKKGAEYIMVDESITKDDVEDNWDIYKRSPLTDYFTKFQFDLNLGEEGTKQKMVNPFTLWNGNINRRDVRAIAFDPRPAEEQAKNIFNIWQGYNVTREEAEEFDVEDGKAMEEHIFNIWACGNVEYFDYAMNWFAHIIQKPWVKIGTLMALQSEQGAGKGVVFEFMGKIIGPKHFSQTATLRDILGDFNSGLEGKVLIDLDEAFWGGDKKLEGMMKNMITDPEVTINRKGKEQYKIMCPANFCITTNNDLFAGVDKGDRRHFALALSNLYAGVQTPSIKAYIASVRGVEGTEHVPRSVYGGFAKILYNRDLSGYNPRSIPRTDLLQDQVERNWSDIVKWWFSVIKEGRFGMIDENKVNNEYLAYNGSDETWGNIRDSKNGRKTYKERQIKDKIMMMYVKKNWKAEYTQEQIDTWTLRQMKQNKYTDHHAYAEGPNPQKEQVVWNGEQQFHMKKVQEPHQIGYYKDFLYNKYVSGRSGYGTAKSKSDFSKEMLKLFPWKESRPVVKGEKSAPRIWQLPNMTSDDKGLEELREYFCQVQNYPYDFHDCDYNDQIADDEIVVAGDGYAENDGWMSDDSV